MDITTTADAATVKPEPTAMEESEAQEPRTSEKIDLSLGWTFSHDSLQYAC